MKKKVGLSVQAN